ncbi:MAG: hypothetical protein HY220_02170 [Candidatus Sungbacteria bacterium]|uniref:Uncharacterized protein n=1 Tax=Candidatus Sungiibacteriota bacterium TaxID=2750080 RepID=A0A9D6QVJ8_9BACT|nr:hypothetical protein [Candidatus Sungbacteria bacterium]
MNFYLCEFSDLEPVIAARLAEEGFCPGIPQCGIRAKDYRAGKCDLEGCPRRAREKAYLQTTG